MNVHLSRIVELFETAGASRYGMEAVSQLEHALQCAALAEREGAGDALVAASLLHDLGHLVHDLGEDAAAHGVDDRHEFRAPRFLRRVFPDAVTGPVRLHVEAKRYLCIARKGYYDMLSDASRRSLALQGGPHAAGQAARFMDQPHAAQAVQLRVWDDLAKVPGAKTPRLDHFVAVLERCRR